MNPPGKPNQSPALLYVWLPLTSKPPLGSAMTVPVDVVPSPQSIVAVNSPAIALELVSVNVTTVPENGCPATASRFCPLAVMTGGAGATLATLRAVADALVDVSWIATLITKNRFPRKSCTEPKKSGPSNG